MRFSLVLCLALVFVGVAHCVPVPDSSANPITKLVTLVSNVLNSLLCSLSIDLFKFKKPLTNEQKNTFIKKYEDATKDVYTKCAKSIETAEKQALAILAKYKDSDTAVVDDLSCKIKKTPNCKSENHKLANFKAILAADYSCSMSAVDAKDSLTRIQSESNTIAPLITAESGADHKQLAVTLDGIMLKINSLGNQCAAESIAFVKSVEPCITSKVKPGSISALAANCKCFSTK